MDSIPHASGIYQILCVATGKIYIGSSVNLQHRQRVHLSCFRKQNHPNRYMQSAWNKYGEDAFVFSVIEFVLECVLLEREQYWIDRLQACDRRKGYNLSMKAGAPMAGRKHSPETRAKMSARAKAAQATPEVRARTGARSKAVQGTPEMRAAQSARSKARAASTEYRAGLSARAKASQASPEYRAKMSASVKAARSQPGAHEKISAASKAAQASPEYRAAQSARIKAAWARRKAKRDGS